MSSAFSVGMSRELKVKTSGAHSTRVFHPNLPEVFATPFLCALMEQVSAELMDEVLSPGEQSVGIAMNLKHLAATPLGMEVRVRTEITSVEGRKLTFQLEAFDEAEKIGEALHERFIVLSEKFNARVAEKAKKAGL